MRPTKVSKELQCAIAEEEKRSLIDAAKKKAVAQHADYDTFKKMVCSMCCISYQSLVAV